MTAASVFQVHSEKEIQIVRELFWECLTWANDMNEQEFGLRLDIAAMLEEDIAHLGKFMPPDGCLLLIQSDGSIAGCVCFKKLSTSIGEVKRLYIRPIFRGKGSGKMLVSSLL